MKLVKSLLLGSAAGLVAVAGASAADLGVKKPTAVEYVKTCPQYGAGFFVVPGTTSCLKIIGRVRFEYLFFNDNQRQQDKNQLRARGYFGYDHRTATEYGLLRTYIRGYIGRNNAADYQPVIEYAFIQFGGLTVGRITPVFEHGWANVYNGSGTFGGFSDIAYVNSIGYTYQFGGGFSATIALDSANERRVAGVTGGAGYAGQAMPDIVGRLDYTGSWGQAFFAGAVHQFRPSATIAGAFPSTQYGWAITGGAKINLPFITQGSNFWFNGTYTEGALSYAGFGSTSQIGSRTYQFSDALYAGTSLQLTTAWSVSGGLEVFATPQIRLGVYGTYANVDPFGAANSTDTYSVWGQAAWLPVSGFQIGGEFGWIQARGDAGSFATGVGSRTQDSYVGRVRFQRDF